MNKLVKNAFGAFISLLCAIISFVAAIKHSEPLMALFVVFSCGAMIAFICEALEGTKLDDKISNIFAEKGGEDE